MKKIEYYLVREGKKLKLIETTKVTINRNTPVGDPPDYYEVKPYGGRKLLDVIGVLTEHEYKEFQLERFELKDNYGRSIVLL